MRHLVKSTLQRIANGLNDFYEKVKKYPAILLLLVILILLSIKISITNFLGLKDLATNLIAGFITLIITVFVIDVLLEKRRNQELHEAKEVLIAELDQLTNKMTSYISIPLGVQPITFAELSQSDESMEKLAKDMMRKTLDKMLTSGFIEAKVKDMTVDSWKHFELNLMDVRSSLDEIFKVYQSILPLKLLGKLYKARKAFMDLYFNFGLYSQTFVHNPIPNRESLKLTMEREISKSLELYYEELASLLEELKSLK